MSKKLKSLQDDPEQLKRFKEMAREVGAHEQAESFDRVLRKVAEQSPGQKPKKLPQPK